jgi:hypothetical protein
MNLKELLQAFREAEKEFKPLSKHHADANRQGREFLEHQDDRLLNYDSIAEALGAFIARHREGELVAQARDLKEAVIGACQAATKAGGHVQSARDALTAEVARMSREKADATLLQYGIIRDDARAALAPFYTSESELTETVRNLPKLALIENEANSWRRFHDLESRAEILLALLG